MLFIKILSNELQMSWAGQLEKAWVHTKVLCSPMHGVSLSLTYMHHRGMKQADTDTGTDIEEIGQTDKDTHRHTTPHHNPESQTQIIMFLGKLSLKPKKVLLHCQKSEPHPDLHKVRECSKQTYCSFLH